MKEHKVLYVGLDAPSTFNGHPVTHCPLIRIAPIPHTDQAVTAAFARMEDFTHLLFTSKSAVEIFFSYATHFGTAKGNLRKKTLFAVGQRTAAKIAAHIEGPVAIAEEETAEGVVAMLEKFDLSHSFLFWPHSSLSRPVISNWLITNTIRHINCPFYHTRTLKVSPLPALDSYNEIVFTSPSTIDAFIQNFGPLPKDKHLTCIGPITAAHLEKSK